MTETAGQIDIFEVLAAAEAEVQNLHVQRHGIPTLFASPTRGVAARIAEFETWATTWGRHGSSAASHAFAPGICDPTTPTDTCQPTCIAADLDCQCPDTSRDAPCQCVGGDVYRGACTGCPWEGENRADEADAVCDALDHAHPGWIDDFPIVIPERRPSQKDQVWTAKVIDIVGERPAGWPVITRRGDTIGLRSVPNRSPWGGYDVAATTAAAHLARKP